MRWVKCKAKAKVTDNSVNRPLHLQIRKKEKISRTLILCNTTINYFFEKSQKAVIP